MKLRLAAVGFTVFALYSAAGNARGQGVDEPDNFVISQHCAPTSGAGPVIVVFGIPGEDETEDLLGTSREPAEVWIDISLFDNNFARGTYLGAGPFREQADGEGYWYLWTGITDSRIHYYRLNALVDGRWQELGRGSFETVDCFRVDEMHCEPDGQASVQFALPPNQPTDQPPAIEQWIDISLGTSFAFPRGGFIAAGPFPPPRPSPPVVFAWENIQPGLRHSYRVNTLLQGGRWDTSSRGTFTSLDCRNLVETVGPRI